MLTQLFVSGCIASTYTAMFTFRFRHWNKPLVVLAAFCAFFGAELLAEWLLIPPGAFGVEIGVVCLVLTGLISGAMGVASRFDPLGDDD